MIRRILAAAALLAAAPAFGGEPLGQAQACEKQGDLPRALELYQEALKAGAADLMTALDAQEGMARVLARQGIFDKASGIYRAALTRLDEAMAQAPTPALARRGCAMAFSLGDYPRALRYCATLLPETCEPADRDWALEQTCICHARMDNWDGLAAFGERSLPSLPKGNRRAWLQMMTARAHARQGEQARAEALYRELLADYAGTQAAALAQARLAALKVQADLALKARDIPQGEAAVDFRRLAEALSHTVNVQQGLSGFRISTDKGAIRVALIGPDEQSQEIVVSKESDLRQGSPGLWIVYSRLGEGIASPPLKEAAHPGYLGISVHPLSPDLATVLRLKPGTPGVLVDSVRAGSPAEGAGLQAGDVLLTLNGQPVDSFNLRARVRSIPAGEAVRLGILRVGGSPLDLEARIGEAP